MDRSAQRDSEGSGAGGDVHSAVCSSVVQGDVISCSGCYCRFHADVACVGVDHEVISCLLRKKSGVLKYFCCRCRIRESPIRSDGAEQAGVWSAFDQLLKVVGILSKRVGEMTK